jgi:hypothetical protein
MIRARDPRSLRALPIGRSFEAASWADVGFSLHAGDWRRMRGSRGDVVFESLERVRRADIAMVLIEQ